MYNDDDVITNYWGDEVSVSEETERFFETYCPECHPRSCTCGFLAYRAECEADEADAALVADLLAAAQDDFDAFEEHVEIEQGALDADARRAWGG